MNDPAAAADGVLLALALAVPATAVPLAVAAGDRHAGRVALLALPVGFGLALAIAVAVARRGEALVYTLGGWPAPLGVALRADGLSAVMLLLAAIVITAAALFARPGLAPASERRARGAFWPLLLAVWGGLVAVFLGSDLFNLFVALELLSFAAVPLVCLDGRAETLAAALRYLVVALLGSVLYLLGTALLHGAYGTLDIGLLAARARPDTATGVAAALMTVGLLAKTALFPLHVWLPPAHAGAPPAASAVLSSLVVKGSFVVVVRLWFDALPGLATPALAQGIAALGAAAILVGSVLALRQTRLKLLVAYSTVAQIGYLFLMFPLAFAAGTPGAGRTAFVGGILQAVSHAIAKAAMFLSAGLVAKALGHDRIAGLEGIGRAMPVTLFAFALGGLSLMGLPPSGGFAAKWMLLRAALEAGQWGWALVVVAGGMFTGGYLYRVLAPALAAGGAAPAVRAPVDRGSEAVVLALALLSVAIGLLPLASFGLIHVGRPG